MTEDPRPAARRPGVLARPGCDRAEFLSGREAIVAFLCPSRSERKYRWPLGPRPDGHPGLSELGL
ncbi:hypothetical protein ACPCIU_23425 [Streptomyces seoulensis]|uniref:hypothetical protein n=1 Tax=Streptomyces seoulensis TaxID=73044 RepID=UPI003C2F09D0